MMCNKNLFVFVVLLCSIVFVVKSRPAGEEDPDDELSGYENEDEEDNEVEQTNQQQQQPINQVNGEDDDYIDYEIEDEEKPEPVQQTVQQTQQPVQQQQQPVIQQQQQPVIQQQQQQPVQQPVVVQQQPQQPVTSGGGEFDEDQLAKACAQCKSDKCALEEGCSKHYVTCYYESVKAVCNGKQVFIPRQSQCGPLAECYKTLNNKA